TGGSASFTPLTTYTQVRYGTSFSTAAPLVVAGDPSTSVIVQKTLSTATMYSYLGPDTKTRDANAKMISDWITQGAINTAVVGPATQIAVASGNNQTTTVGTAVTKPLVAKAMDAN